MKLKLIKILAWTGLLGLFAVGTGACTPEREKGLVGRMIMPDPDVVQLDGEIVCPAPAAEPEEEDVELAPVPAADEDKDGKKGK